MFPYFQNNKYYEQDDISSGMREEIQMDTGSQKRNVCYLLDGLPSAFEFFHSKHIRRDKSYKQGNEPSSASPDEKISTCYKKWRSLLKADEFER